jgi:hypothetical protein
MIIRQDRRLFEMRSRTDLVRLNVEVPKDLLRRLKQRALDSDVDLRTVVITALVAALAKPMRKGGRA